ncbi:MAG: sigma factor-like helix-turn-helix DNA-binding protein [bacterium]|nr:sigma factor-like helix-turn-helix DNA-binding protein [bacterium]
MKFNYSQICFEILKDLPKRQKDVLLRRFGLRSKAGKRETLESIGKSMNVTRERVRQIERDGFLGLKSEVKNSSVVFQFLQECLKKKGGLKREEALLEELGGQKEKNQIYFLLTLSENFQRFAETEDFYSLWTLGQNYLLKAEKVLTSIYSKLKKFGKPATFNGLKSFGLVNQNTLASCLEVSRKIQRNSEGFYGLKEWPEINPRGVKDKAYIVFKKEKRPLHFNEVASLLEKALPQTVHNELIKDPRFVLVGRGLYALQEWGYEQGYVKDVIYKILKEAKGPLSKEDVLAKVLKQRMVKENTILLNLNNNQYFSKTPEGGYTIKEA